MYFSLGGMHLRSVYVCTCMYSCFVRGSVFEISFLLTISPTAYKYFHLCVFSVRFSASYGVYILWHQVCPSFVIRLVRVWSSFRPLFRPSLPIICHYFGVFMVLLLSPFQTKFETHQNEAFVTVSTLQEERMELVALKDTLTKYIRQLEQNNDDLERGKRY